jgi:DNA polymerase-3 subunit alpha
MAVVKTVKKFHYKGKVHDLCVAGPHTYNIEGLAVHNSAAGSLVSYCLGLTDLEPIEYGLLFERFLDYSRRPVNACTFKV